MFKWALLIVITGPVCLYAQGPPTVREKQLMDEIQRLEARVSALEQKLNGVPSATTTTPAPAPTVTEAGQASPRLQPEAAAANTRAAHGSLTDFLAGTTFNFMLDGYYAYNFNHPIGRVNLLRA